MTTNIADILAKLDQATKLLVDTSPDMEVSEWNQTPVGQAVALIDEVRELIEGLEGD